MTESESEWCYTCEQFHGPMGWGDGCTDDRDLARERVKHLLPWAPSFGWLTGRQCSARLPREVGQSYGRWGRCELRHGHVAYDNSLTVDHALEWGFVVLRWRRWQPVDDVSTYLEEGIGR